jgi:hypothetical protein
VLAAGDDGQVVHVGDHYVNVQSTTLLENGATGQTVLLAAQDTGGTAVSGWTNPASTGTAGIGIDGRSQSRSDGTGAGTGVYGGSLQSTVPAPTAPAKVGVYGVSDIDGSIGVQGETNVPYAQTYGVHGLTVSTNGRAVFGWSRSFTAGTGTWGQADGAGGVGVRGFAWDGSSPTGQFGTGVLGSSGTHSLPPPKALANTGVYGVGVHGRGVVAKGDKAQVRLIPSSAAMHPTRGVLGDLFLDKAGRLWFCKGSTNWKRLA